MRVHLLLFTAVSLFVSHQASCQQYHEGYVILTNLDTLKGYIQAKGSIQTISFKNKKDEAAKQFGPADLYGFYLKDLDERYLARQINLDVKPIEPDKLDTDNPSAKMESRKVFLKVLVGGKVSLYSCTTPNPDKEHFLIQVGEGMIEELILIKYINSALNTMQVVNAYKSQLAAAMKDCPTIKTTVSFNEQPLKNLVLKYNTCIGAQSTVTGKLNKHKPLVYFSLGANSMNFKYIATPDGPSYAPIKSITFPRSFGVTAAMGIESSPEKKVVTFGGDLVIQAHSFSGSYKDASNIVSANFGFWFINANPFVTFNFGDRIKPFLRVGPSVGYSIDTGSHTKFEYEPGFSGFSYDGTVGTLPTLTVGYFAGAGVRAGRYIIELRYSGAKAGAPNTIFATSSIGLMAGITLNNK